FSVIQEEPPFLQGKKGARVGGIPAPLSCFFGARSGTVKTVKGGHAMGTVRGKCSACGAPLELTVADTFAGAVLAAALCPGCTDQKFLDGGGAILQLGQEPERALFPLGKVTITGGAVETLAEAGQHAATFLARHARGDWGEAGHFDRIELTDDE